MHTLQEYEDEKRLEDIISWLTYNNGSTNNHDNTTKQQQQQKQKHESTSKDSSSRCSYLFDGCIIFDEAHKDKN